MKIQSNQKLRRNDELIHSAIDNETVMMSLERDEYYGLDEIATDIWNLLGEPRSAEEILDNLDERFETDRETIATDLMAFLNDMVESKVLLTD